MTFNFKKICLIAMFLIIAAIAVVICVNLFTGNEVREFDGTLVKSVVPNWSYL